MKIGIVSDSHGKTRLLEEALNILADRHVEVVVHCGDICDAKSMQLLGRFGRNAYVVAGNMDRHADELMEEAANLGIHFGWEVIEIPLGNGQNLIATHGHDKQLLGELISEERFPYICCGHTHCYEDEYFGKTRVINPGSLYHPRDHFPPSIAILNTETDELTRIPIGK